MSESILHPLGVTPPPAPRALLATKTSAVNLVIIIVAQMLPLFGITKVQEFVSAHPSAVLTALGILGILVRRITNGRAVLWGSDQ